MALAFDQKAVFADRINRIQSGKQFEHSDLVNRATQKAIATKTRQAKLGPKRSRKDNLMVLFAFVAGMAAVILGRIAYFKLSTIEGLPPAFYDLGTRGMVLFALVLAGLMVVFFHLTTKSRFPALMVGCMAMHFGEAALAANAPGLWSQLVPADYAAEVFSQSADSVALPQG